MLLLKIAPIHYLHLYFHDKLLTEYKSSFDGPEITFA